MKRNKTLIIVFFVFLITYLLLFLQFPMNNTIGGTCDALLTISSSNYFSNFLGALFSGNNVTSSLYPASNILQFGERALGLLSLFNFFKMLGCSDVTSWYFFVVTIFTLNSFGVSLLVYYYTKKWGISVLGGFLFACTNFAFVNLDDAHVLFYFFSVLAIVFLLRYKENKKRRYLLFATVLSAVQLYFSLYVFVYGFVVFLVFFVYAHDYFKQFNLKTLKHLLWVFFIYSIAITPFILFYFQSQRFLNFYLPDSGKWNDIASYSYLKISDFFGVMPNNILYHSDYKASDLLFSFFDIRKSAFIGTLFMSLGLFYMVKHFRKFLPWVIVFILGLLLSTYFYKVMSSNIFILQVVRLSYRGYLISVLALSVMVALGLNKSLANMGKTKQMLILGAILIIHLLENIPYPFPLSNHEKLKNEIHTKANIELADGLKAKNLIPDKKWVKIVKQTTDKSSVILCLPSNRIFGGDLGMLTYNRELFYMNHQTYYKRNMFNGVHGYFPKSRIDIQQHIDSLPKENALQELVEAGMTHIIFYKNMVLDEHDKTLKEINTLKNLKVVEENNTYVVFQVNNEWL
ncbi:MAG: hypothetical protein PF590_01145 [Candidatus Delongbacteria bacterium]|jgi:hypothetical protein|nr:hypothetical protein [Candidatus Delongbacteria bacterium]